MTSYETIEVLAVLDGADRDALALVVVGPSWREVYAGNVTYRIAGPDGQWFVFVFNDCDDWDYVDRIDAPDGRSWEFPCDDAVSPMSWDVANWVPKTERWGYRRPKGLLHGLLRSLCPRLAKAVDFLRSANKGEA